MSLSSSRSSCRPGEGRPGSWHSPPGARIAGNLTILGAASNVIIIQQAEARGETLTFTEFAKVGVPLTLIQIGIYAVFLGVV